MGTWELTQGGKNKKKFECLFQNKIFFIVDIYIYIHNKKTHVHILIDGKPCH